MRFDVVGKGKYAAFPFAVEKGKCEGFCLEDFGAGIGVVTLIKDAFVRI